MNGKLREASGFTLIEGLAAAVVLTVGLLALAGMQSISLTRNVDANELTIATNLAADMLERVRFNRLNVASYMIDTNNACTQSATSQPMAWGDCTQWRTLVQSAALPGARGVVTVIPFGAAAINSNQVNVQITWNRAAGGDSAVTRVRGNTAAMIFTTVVAPD